MGGGRGHLLWVVGTFNYEEIKPERGVNLVSTILNIHTPLSPHFHPNFFYLPLLNSVAKRIFLGIKNIGGAFAPHPKLRLLK